MKSEDDSVTIFRVFFLSIGSYLIGSEYSASLGWGIWFIAMATD